MVAPPSLDPTSGHLVRATASAFPTRAAREGRGAFLAGQVVIEGSDASTVYARVTSADRPRPYLVVVSFAESATRGRLAVACGCPADLAGRLCEHVQAVLFAIDHADLAAARRALAEPRLDVRVDRALARPDDWFFVSDGALGRATPSGPREDPWTEQLRSLRRASTPLGTLPPLTAALDRPRPGELRYAVDVARSEATGALCVRWSRRGADGAQEAGRLLLSARSLEDLPDPADRAALEPLLALAASAGVAAGADTALVPGAFLDRVLPALATTGRLELDAAPGEPLTLDPGPRWRLAFEIGPAGDALWGLRGQLVRPGEALPLEPLGLLLRDGVLVHDGRIGRLETGEGFAWAAQLRKQGSIVFPAAELPRVLGELAAFPELPPLALPAPWTSELGAPRPRIALQAPQGRLRTLGAKVSFEYGDTLLSIDTAASAIVDLAGHRLVRRDRAEETRRLGELARLAPQPASPGAEVDLELPTGTFPLAAQALLAAGWRVEAAGRALRALSAPRLRLGSGKDWFELEGTLDFGGVQVALPDVLRAVREGGPFVSLGDGVDGVLPEAWVERLRALDDLGALEGDHLRFRFHHALFLDALLAEESLATTDPGFERVRARLRRAARPGPRREPPTFRGELRRYQREGLGWLRQLGRLGLGGCLADDMGLGKTVQVLALLEGRRRALARAGQPRRPSLVVAPKSLVRNWLEEATRFTPGLRAMLHAGTQREERFEELAHQDLVVTTYGTVRRDIEQLRTIPFDLVVLDEAQLVKNAASQASKAVRLLPSTHRLALSGTPVENHLGELWAIFDFLAPGLLGARARLGAVGRGEDPEHLALLARALRPLILRRTKSQVLTELPPKTELTLHCELEGEQARLYRELRDHYRTSLRQRIETEGLGRSRIHVLEALLRLRQAACHPGLLDEGRRGEGSSKLDTLLEQLTEVLSEGHKALVFSQFVKLLGLVRERLDARGVRYAYLDGATTDRQAEVRRFQEDPGCNLFLVSLKAGGLGLNLTAADYVFILDPWWNPAVEAQAIDRAHRLGQTRPVFAYRLIARDTVEEKILELHAQKRQLAQAIIGEENAVAEQLTMEDLELLLG